MTLFEQFYIKTTEDTRKSLESMALALSVNVSSMKNWTSEKANIYHTQSDTAKQLTSKVDMYAIRANYAYKNDLDNIGIADVNGTACKSMSAIADALGISKQDYSRHCQICSMPIGFDDEYANWNVYQFTCVHNILKDNKLTTPFEWSMINPLMTANDIKALHKRLKALNEKEDGESNGESNGENNGTATATEPITYSEKYKCWRFNNCTATALQNWLHENVTTAENADKMTFTGTIKPKTEK